MFKVERSQLLSLTLFQSVGSHRLQDHLKRFLTFPIHINRTLKYSQHHSAFTVGGIRSETLSNGVLEEKENMEKC